MDRWQPEHLNFHFCVTFKGPRLADLLYCPLEKFSCTEFMVILGQKKEKRRLKELRNLMAKQWW